VPSRQPPPPGEAGRIGSNPGPFHILMDGKHLASRTGRRCGGRGHRPSSPSRNPVPAASARPSSQVMAGSSGSSGWREHGAPAPPGVAAAPVPSVRTSVGSITDRPIACQRSAATACASSSVTHVKAVNQSLGPCSAEPGSDRPVGYLAAARAQTRPSALTSTPLPRAWNPPTPIVNQDERGAVVVRERRSRQHHRVVGPDDVSYRGAVLWEHPAVRPRTPITNPPRRRMSEQVVPLRARDAEGRR
jgi:hypothetical protein